MTVILADALWGRRPRPGAPFRSRCSQRPHGTDRALGSIGVGFRLDGEHTGGQVAIVEHPFPPGALVPPHVHTREDEFSIVTAGAIGFRSGSDEVVLEAGGYIASHAASCTRCGTPDRTRRA